MRSNPNLQPELSERLRDLFIGTGGKVKEPEEVRQDIAAHRLDLRDRPHQSGLERLFTFALAHLIAANGGEVMISAADMIMAEDGRTAPFVFKREHDGTFVFRSIGTSCPTHPNCRGCETQKCVR